MADASHPGSHRNPPTWAFTARRRDRSAGRLSSSAHDNPRRRAADSGHGSQTISCPRPCGGRPHRMRESKRWGGRWSRCRGGGHSDPLLSAPAEVRAVHGDAHRPAFLPLTLRPGRRAAGRARGRSSQLRRQPRVPHAGVLERRAAGRRAGVGRADPGGAGEGPEGGRIGEFGVFDDERVEAALRRVGCGEKHGVSVGNGYYAVYTGVVCVSGRVTKDELTGEVHGVYAEPQPGEGPCVENRGGH